MRYSDVCKEYCTYYIRKDYLVVVVNQLKIANLNKTISVVQKKRETNQSF